MNDNSWAIEDITNNKSEIDLIRDIIFIDFSKMKNSVFNIIQNNEFEIMQNNKILNNTVQYNTVENIYSK